MMCAYCGLNNPYLYCEHDAFAFKTLGPGYSRLYYHLWLYKRMYEHSRVIRFYIPSWEEYKFHLLWDEIKEDWLKK